MPLAHAIVVKISDALKEPNNTRSNRLWKGLKKYYHLNRDKTHFVNNIKILSII